MERLSRLLNVGKSPANDEEPERVRLFTYKYLKKATRNFTDAVGVSRDSRVYKGKFPNGQMVVVREQLCAGGQLVDVFTKWAEALYRYDHQNLVAFLGYTDHLESKRLFMVYEFVPNGSLTDNLYWKQPALTWNVRIKIAIEIAAVVVYLHSVHSVHSVLPHGVPAVDVTSSNILLDENFHAKFKGLGRGALYPWHTGVTSTMAPPRSGYQDPEYMRTFERTDKTDVYSFGVVLLELMSGQLAVDFDRNEESIYLVDMGLNMILNNKLVELVDPMLGYHIDGDVTRMIDSVAVLASNCLERQSNVRPPMADALRILNGINDGTN